MSDTIKHALAQMGSKDPHLREQKLTAKVGTISANIGVQFFDSPFINVRFQCQGCGNVLKTKESFYFHRSNYCRNLYNVSAEPGFQMLLSKEKEDEEKNANASIDKETKEAQHKPDEENEDCQVGTQKHGLRSTRQGNI